jgi:hypothetical protein
VIGVKINYRSEDEAREALRTGREYGCGPPCSFCLEARAFLAGGVERDREAILASRPETD